MDNFPSVDRIREVFDYDPTTGDLIFRRRTSEDGHSRRWNARCAGKRTGKKERCGYVQVRVDGVAYMAHRIAWAHFYGKRPFCQIDHIDGDRSNNAIANLRLATASTNAANRRVRPGTKSGFKGVTYNKRLDRWVARIKQDGHRRSLGYYKTVEEAAQAYEAAAKEIFGEFARVA